jgi:hypothetical protein
MKTSMKEAIRKLGCNDEHFAGDNVPVSLGTPFPLFNDVFKGKVSE